VATMVAHTSMGARNTIVAFLENRGQTAALEIKLTLVDPATGARVLPAYYSDNYISLLPGEKREIAIQYDATRAVPQLMIRGWNVPSGILTVEKK